MFAPEVSVILPVHNAARYLGVALESILTQAYKNFEIIAVDDGSTDASLRILKIHAARDTRIRIISRPNTGIVGAMEDARAVARGEFLARMDADDWAAPERFTFQVAAMRAAPELVALGSGAMFMDEAGHVVEKCPRHVEPAAVRAALLGGDGGALIHPAVMFRAAAVETVGGYRRVAQYVEDLDLYLRLERVGLLSNLSDTLLHYRVHSKSINFTKNEGRHAARIAILREAYRVRGIPFDLMHFPDETSAHTDLSCLHRNWAVTALALSPRRVAVAHGWRAVCLAPRDPIAWRALRYALTAPNRMQHGKL